MWVWYVVHCYSMNPINRAFLFSGFMKRSSSILSSLPSPLLIILVLFWMALCLLPLGLWHIEGEWKLFVLSSFQKSNLWSFTLQYIFSLCDSELVTSTKGSLLMDVWLSCYVGSQTKNGLGLTNCNIMVLMMFTSWWWSHMFSFLTVFHKLSWQVVMFLEKKNLKIILFSRSWDHFGHFYHISSDSARLCDFYDK